MANIGDKYIIEIGEMYESHDAETEDQSKAPGELYRVKGFRSLVFDSQGLEKLEKYIARENETGYQHGYEDGFAAAKYAEAKNDTLVAIGDCKAGDVVEFAGIEWEILDEHYATGIDIYVFCLAKHVLFKKEFDKGNNNNWKESSLREYLNGEYAEKLREVPLYTFTRDLTAEDGLEDYGQCQDKVSILSCNEYRKYRRFISNKAATWWTLTPYSTPTSGNSYIARYVNTDGTLRTNSACYGNIGVVPACAVPASSLVIKVQEVQ